MTLSDHKFQLLHFPINRLPYSDTEGWHLGHVCNITKWVTHTASSSSFREINHSRWGKAWNQGWLWFCVSHTSYSFLSLLGDCMPASSSDYLFPLHSSAQFIMDRFPSLSSSKRKVMLKSCWSSGSDDIYCVYWASGTGWLDIHFLTARPTSKPLPLLAFSFLKAALWPHNIFYPSLLRSPLYFQIWTKISSDNLGAIAKY